ncbi:MAG: TetR/AcrR family transcriptional regulator [Actinomycetales bacterium]
MVQARVQRNSARILDAEIRLAAAELVVISCFESQVRDAVEATLVPVTRDWLTDDLLRLAIDHLGRRGYEGSHLADIAGDAGVTEATIYLRYPTKEAFLMDAINRQQDITMPGQRAYLARLEQAHGVGMAEAVAIRDTMHPRERLINMIEIERARLTWHRPNLAAADEDRLQRLRQEVLQVDPGNRDFADPARLHLGRAVGLGITLLPLVDDRAWDQPYDVVTTPMSQT